MAKIKKVFFFFIDDGKKERRSMLWSFKKSAEKSRLRFFKGGVGVSKLKSKIVIVKKKKKFGKREIKKILKAESRQKKAVKRARKAGLRV